MEREVQYLSVGCSNEDAVGYWFYHNGLDVDFYCSFLNWLTRLVWMYTGNLEGLRIKEWDLSVVWVLQMNMEDDESARLDIDIFIQALEYFRGRVWLKEKMTWYDGFLRRGSSASMINGLQHEIIQRLRPKYEYEDSKIALD